MDKLIVGCGYLGRRVAARWLAQGHRVFGTTRSANRAEELRRLGIVPVICDVLNKASLHELPSVETVLYCVGFDRSAGRSMRDVYVEGLRNFFTSASLPEASPLPCTRGRGVGGEGVEILQKIPPPHPHPSPPSTGERGFRTRLLYVSSTGVYGQCNDEEVGEDSATEPQEEPGRVVLEAERIINGSWLDGGVRILRFAGIYGPGRVIRRQTIEAGEPLLGDPEKWLNLIHVEDGAAAVLAAEERGKLGGIYNVSDDCPVRRRDFYVRLAELLGAPEPRFVLPAPGEPLPPHERTNRRINNRRLREELGVTLRYPSYREGLPAALAER